MTTKAIKAIWDLSTEQLTTINEAKNGRVELVRLWSDDHCPCVEVVLKPFRKPAVRTELWWLTRGALIRLSNKRAWAVVRSFARAELADKDGDA